LRLIIDGDFTNLQDTLVANIKKGQKSARPSAHTPKRIDPAGSIFIFVQKRPVFVVLIKKKSFTNLWGEKSSNIIPNTGLALHLSERSTM
jgi:hypothetical protein